MLLLGCARQLLVFVSLHGALEIEGVIRMIDFSGIAAGQLKISELAERISLSDIIETTDAQIDAWACSWA
jgi:hypothetical protein